MGQKLPKWAVHPMSAFPPIATVERTCEEVRSVPLPTVSVCASADANSDTDGQLLIYVNASAAQDGFNIFG